MLLSHEVGKLEASEIEPAQRNPKPALNTRIEYHSLVHSASVPVIFYIPKPILAGTPASSLLCSRRNTARG